MGPRRQTDEGLKPVDGIGLSLPVVLSLAATAVLGAASFAWFLSGLANGISERIGRVEYQVQSLNHRIEALTTSVDLGVSTMQAEGWIRLFRAQLQAIEPRLIPAVPDLPARERGREK